MVFPAAVKQGNFWIDQEHPDCAYKKYAALLIKRQRISVDPIEPVRLAKGPGFRPPENVGRGGLPYCAVQKETVLPSGDAGGNSGGLSFLCQEGHRDCHDFSYRNPMRGKIRETTSRKHEKPQSDCGSTVRIFLMLAKKVPALEPEGRISELRNAVKSD